MVRHRMALSIQGDLRVASQTQFVGGLFDHERFIAGVWAVAGNAAGTGYDSVHVWQPFLLVLVYEILLVAVADDAQVRRSFGPQLVSVILPMGIVAKSTPPNIDRAMDVRLGIPGFFANMAAEADFLGFHFRQTELPRFG